MSRRLARHAVLLLSAFLASTAAQATWSVAAVHAETGTIGVAAASCSYMVYGIAEVLPGQGVVIVQAASSAEARAEGVRRLALGEPLARVLTAMRDVRWAPEQQQIALLSLKEEMPEAFSGPAIADRHDLGGGIGFSLQGNSLASAAVVPAMQQALGARDRWGDDLVMEAALMRALEAGALAGGDHRCPSGGRTAYLSLHRRSDAAQLPWLTLAVFGLPEDQGGSVNLLQVLFDAWLRDGHQHPSSRQFIVPRP